MNLFRAILHKKLQKRDYLTHFIKAQFIICYLLLNMINSLYMIKHS